MIRKSADWGLEPCSVSDWAASVAYHANCSSKCSHLNRFCEEMDEEMMSMNENARCRNGIPGDFESEGDMLPPTELNRGGVGGVPD